MNELRHGLAGHIEVTLPEWLESANWVRFAAPISNRVETAPQRPQTRANSYNPNERPAQMGSFFQLRDVDSTMVSR